MTDSWAKAAAEHQRRSSLTAERGKPAYLWIGEHFHVKDAETGRARLFVVWPWTARILDDLYPVGTPVLPYSLALWSTLKKSGKTAVNGAICTYLGFDRAPDGSELYTFANSQEQSVGRVFRAMKYAIEHDSYLQARVADELETKIRLTNGTFIQAMAAMHANIAGANPYYSGWTELWGYIHPKELRAWAEMTPPPTVRDSMRVVDTYAGYEGESTLLNNLEDQAKAGRRLYSDGFEVPGAYRAYAVSMIAREPHLAPFLLPPDEVAALARGKLDAASADPVRFDIPIPVYVDEDTGLYCYWDEGVSARRLPWQTGEWGEKYYRQQKRELAAIPGAFDRLHLNVRSKRGGQFVPVADWLGLPTATPWRRGDTRAVTFAVDAATRDDHMALVGVTVDNEGAPHQVYCETWEPRADPRASGKLIIDPSWAGQRIMELREQGMHIAAVAYDPYQFEAVALSLSGAGIAIDEFNQGVRRLRSDTALHKRITTGALAHAHDPALTAAIESANARPEPGATGDQKRIRIVKGTGKVDPLVALSMACDAALGDSGTGIIEAPVPQGIVFGGGFSPGGA